MKTLYSLLFFATLAACGNSNGGQDSKPSSTIGTNGTVTDSNTTTGNGALTTPAPAHGAAACSTAAADINITVSSKVGPQGTGSPRTISNNMYSMNIDDQVRDDYVPTPNAQYVAFLKALKPQLLRFPAGYNGQQYTYLPQGPDGMYNMTPTLIDAFVNLANAVGAKPYLSINISSTDDASVQNAKDFLTYTNITKKYGVTWWQLGNEPDVDGLDSNTHNPQTYAATFLQYAKALKGVDPTIKLAGAELMTGADIMGTNGSTDWLTPILSGTASAPMDAIVWHYYPMDSSQTSTTSSAYPTSAHVLQEDANDWAPAGLDFASQIFPVIAKEKAQYAPQAQVWVDEFAEDSGKLNGQGTGNTITGALWAADALGRFAEYGADATFKFIFKGGPEHYYTMIDSNNVPRPEYYTYWMYAQQFGDQVVQAKSDQIASVSAHAAMRSADGSLRVILTNKLGTAQNVRVTLSDYKPVSAASFTLEGTSYDATDATLNGQAFSMTNIVNGAGAVAPQAAQACADNVVKMPAFSVTMLVFNPK